MEALNVPICKQCKHRTVFYSCLKGKSVRNHITGEFFFHSCTYMRGVEDMCGLDGKMFEPKRFGQALINMFKC